MLPLHPQWVSHWNTPSSLVREKQATHWEVLQWGSHCEFAGFEKTVKILTGRKENKLRWREVKQGGGHREAIVGSTRKRPQSARPPPLGQDCFSGAHTRILFISESSSERLMSVTQALFETLTRIWKDCVCVCVFTICVCIHACMWSPCVCGVTVCMCACVCGHHLCVRVYLRACHRVCVHVCMVTVCVCVCIHVCLWLCVCGHCVCVHSQMQMCFFTSKEKKNPVYCVNSGHDIQVFQFLRNIKVKSKWEPLTTWHRNILKKNLGRSTVDHSLDKILLSFPVSQSFWCNYW